MRYIWLVGPQACGKSTLARDREWLKSHFDLEETIVVRFSHDDASPSMLRAFARQDGVQAVVQVWQWRTHAHLQWLYSLVEHKEIEVYLIKPHLADWAQWYEAKYSPVDGDYLMRMWHRVRRLLRDTVPKFEVIQLPKNKETQDNDND